MSVAVVMPYYNEKELLYKALQGILKQTYEDWHLFLVDDGSLYYNRASLVIDLLGIEPRKVTTVYKNNGGVSTARNTALNLIRNCDPYKYVAYCDGDDVWDENYLEEQIYVLTQGPDLVYSDVRHRFIDGSVAVPYGISNYSEYPGLETLVKGNFIFVSGVVHKCSCLGIGEFDNSVNGIEDWDFWCRIAEAGYKLAKNMNSCFTYTVKPNGNGSKGNKEVYDKFYLKRGKYTVNA
jgi:glycosyltransferase involved in cell wall biosynthesis